MITATRYRIELACVPFPFQSTIVAFNRESAIKKALFQARQCKLDAKEVLEVYEVCKVKIENKGNSILVKPLLD
jgi:hypothetical protein